MLAPVSSNHSLYYSILVSKPRPGDSLSPYGDEMMRPPYKQYLAALHGVCQTLQLPVGHRHVKLAHGAILEAPAFTVVVDELSCLAGEEQGFLVVLLSDMNN